MSITNCWSLSENRLFAGRRAISVKSFSSCKRDAYQHRSGSKCESVTDEEFTIIDANCCEILSSIDERGLHG